MLQIRVYLDKNFLDLQLPLFLDKNNSARGNNPEF
jgi:hypothetical protein